MGNGTQEIGVASVDLKEAVSVENVLLGMGGGKKKDALEALFAFCVRSGGLSPSQLKAALSGIFKREKVGTTGLGNGIAVPHVDVEGLKEPLVALGVSPKGIPFESLDGEPAKLILLILSPAEDVSLRRKLVAQFCRLGRDPYFVGSILDAPSPKAVVDILRSEL
ncbi:MAG TPA: PTS sugar transporter subunit IIA [Elusimicrobiota bacterium]|nr:PTS sugar transporter subunit IIA [Elusimicrobiota bacterium]